METPNGRQEQVERHAATSLRFIVQSQEELQSGDTLQASEKAWGAAAHAMKAAAESRGWEHRTHRLLFDVAARIADETGDPELFGLFKEASALHQNFYEGWESDYTVQKSIERVKRLVEKMEALRLQANGKSQGVSG